MTSDYGEVYDVRSGTRGRAFLVGGMLVSVCAGALVASSITAAVADPARPPEAAGPSYPSQRDIDEAREAERAVGDAVARAEARLASFNAELDRAYIEVGKAVEAYNGARLALAEAEETEETARAEARRATAEAKRAQEVLGQVVAASYRQGGELARVGVILSAEDGEALYDSFAAFRSVTGSQAGAYQKAAEATAAAEAAAKAAQRALDEREQATERAEQTYETAERLVAEQENAAAAAEAERQTLIGELAAARGTTVALEEARQQAIAEEEAAEREREARENPDDDGPGGNEGDDGGRDEDRPDREDPDGERPDGDDPDGDDPDTEPTAKPTPTPTAKPSPTPTPTPTKTPKPTPTPTPTEPPPPDLPSGADAAIAYAHEQLGKPYEWGAKGPDSFDCSGLTMRAWEAGGKSLLPWSVGQAEQVSRVSYSDLGPGDLVFWSDNGQASGVHHVGLYIGGDQMIHAPRPGKVVEVQSIWYWIDPAFYGRVT